MFSDFKLLANDGKKLTKHLFCLFLAAFALALFSYFYGDQSLALYFRRGENMNLWLLGREVTNIGLGQHYFIFIFLFLIYLYFLAPRWNPQRETMRQNWLKAWTWNFLAALLTAGLGLQILKYIFGRQRPHISPDSAPQTFQFFNHDWDYQSFPSGHTQVLFTVATMLCVLDRKRTSLWLTLAVIFSFTRVMTYSHFLSDVIVGAFVGIAGSLLSVYLMNRYSRFPLFKK